MHSRVGILTAHPVEGGIVSQQTPCQRGAAYEVEEMHYAYRHFRGPDGRVYGLNEYRPPTTE
ncbi:MAG: hypothetical protein AVDCRST_MAG93-7745 [uncultured Chloroflexia bacterium]|uniref:Uncharacterized protein n=1 Tax=uncultured Chloroflexia bacterium TaxID=1672391 RepID=A0A6J4MN07_9CHLR|nr:MAG: hypothetical protein AVDCRST_MAG93-7745 [uncultured Chloroflexia bacterium]